MPHGNWGGGGAITCWPPHGFIAPPLLPFVVPGGGGGIIVGCVPGGAIGPPVPGGIGIDIPLSCAILPGGGG